MATVLVAGVALTLPVRGDRSSIDPITGSLRFQTYWLFFCTSDEIRHSELERWLVNHEGVYQPEWRFLSRGSQSIFGQNLARGCSNSPEIYPLKEGDFNTLFARNSKDSEIAEFVRVMREGTTSEKDAIVEAVSQTTRGLYAARAAKQGSRP